MAGGISSYPNATGLPSRPMCRDDPGIPRGYPEQTAHAVSVSYTPAPQLKVVICGKYIKHE